MEFTIGQTFLFLLGFVWVVNLTWIYLKYGLFLNLKNPEELTTYSVITVLVNWFIFLIILIKIFIFVIKNWNAGVTF